MLVKARYRELLLAECVHISIMLVNASKATDLHSYAKVSDFILLKANKQSRRAVCLSSLPI